VSDSTRGIPQRGYRVHYSSTFDFDRAAIEICCFSPRPLDFGLSISVSLEPRIAIPPAMQLRRAGARAGPSGVLRKGSTHVVSVGIAILMLSSSAGLVALAGDALPAAFHSTGSKTALDLRTMYLGKTLASDQPSPYCNFGSESSPFILLCYTPADLKVAYNFPTNLDGSGQTVVIVDAFGYPEVQADLNTFDAMFGLPYTKIQIACQGGVCPVFNPNDPDQVGWSGEIAEDVQSVHSLAPGAHIVLFVGSNDDDLTMEEAVLSAVQMFPHSIISQSWGDPELDMLQGTCFDDTDTPTGDCSLRPGDAGRRRAGVPPRRRGGHDRLRLRRGLGRRQLRALLCVPEPLWIHLREPDLPLVLAVGHGGGRHDGQPVL
jgi:hypothetical protein